MRPKTKQIGLVFIVSLYFSFSVIALAQGPIVFSGTEASTTTKPFELYGYSRFTWSGEAEYEDFDIDIMVYKVGEDIWSEWFSGVDGEGYFYEKGMFYLDISAFGFSSWEIRIEHLQLPEPVKITQTVIETVTVDKTMQEIGTPALLLTVLFVAFLTLTLNQRRKNK